MLPVITLGHLKNVECLSQINAFIGVSNGDYEVLKFFFFLIFESLQLRSDLLNNKE